MHRALLFTLFFLLARPAFGGCGEYESSCVAIIGGEAEEMACQVTECSNIRSGFTYFELANGGTAEINYDTNGSRIKVDGGEGRLLGKEKLPSEVHAENLSCYTRTGTEIYCIRR